VEDCVHDLRRLLDAEGLHDVQILVTSATTGAGVDALRQLLLETVSARRAATARIEADVDGVAARFVPYAGEERAEVPAIPEAGAAAGAPVGLGVAGAVGAGGPAGFGSPGGHGGPGGLGGPSVLGGSSGIPVGAAGVPGANEVLDGPVAVAVAGAAANGT